MNMPSITGTQRAQSDLQRLLVEPRMQQIYQQACKEGTTKIYRTRIMLVGHFAAGKTSVKRSLLNEDFVSRHQTTEGVEAEESVNVFTTRVKEEGNGSRWKKVRCKISPLCIHQLWETILIATVKVNVPNHEVCKCMHVILTAIC